MFNRFGTVSEHSMSWEWILAWKGKELIPFISGQISVESINDPTPKARKFKT